MDVDTPGHLIAVARASAGLSLRALADLMGVSAPFLHDVEHDRRRLAPERWASLKRALPVLDVRRLAEATVAAGPVQIDPSQLTIGQRAELADALVAIAWGMRSR